MEEKMNLKEMKEKLSEVDEGTLKRYEIGVSSEDGLTLLTSEEDVNYRVGDLQKYKELIEIINFLGNIELA